MPFELGGLNEVDDLQVAFNDIDYCNSALSARYIINRWAPQAMRRRASRGRPAILIELKRLAVRTHIAVIGNRMISDRNGHRADWSAV